MQIKFTLHIYIEREIIYYTLHKMDLHFILFISIYYIVYNGFYYSIAILSSRKNAL